MLGREIGADASKGANLLPQSECLSVPLRGRFYKIFPRLVKEQFCRKITASRGRQPSLDLSRTATNRPAKVGPCQRERGKTVCWNARRCPACAPRSQAPPGSAPRRQPVSRRRAFQ